MRDIEIISMIGRNNGAISHDTSVLRSAALWMICRQEANDIAIRMRWPVLLMILWPAAYLRLVDRLTNVQLAKATPAPKPKISRI